MVAAVIVAYQVVELRLAGEVRRLETRLEQSIRSSRNRIGEIHRRVERNQHVFAQLLRRIVAVEKIDQARIMRGHAAAGVQFSLKPVQEELKSQCDLVLQQGDRHLPALALHNAPLRFRRLARHGGHVELLGHAVDRQPHMGRGPRMVGVVEHVERNAVLVINRSFAAVDPSPWKPR